MEPLPKMLPGVICQQWVRCGRPGCRCARGYLHGPYYYHFSRRRGRLRKRYVRSADLERVRAACDARRRQRRELADWQARYEQLADTLREVERS